MNQAGDAVRDWLEQGLRQIHNDLANGADVPPARRFRLEGAIECWARQQGLDAAGLERWLAASELEAEVGAETDRWRVRLQLPMRRAPVKPTTPD